MDRTRKRKILEKVDADGYITVGTMSRLLGCTEATLRRDLKKLDEMGLLKRVHGGAIKIGSNFVYNNVREALYQKIYEKMEIAKVAYDCIETGETIFVDDASTCIHLGNLIMNNRDKNVSVVTNSIILAEKLLDCSHVNLTMIGGTVAKNLASTEGDMALAQINKIHADKAFIGVNGIDFMQGITLTGYPQQKMKQKMMEASKESYILADSSKFEKSYMSRLCGIKEPTAIITDQNIVSGLLMEAREKGITILTKSSQTNKNRS